MLTFGRPAETTCMFKSVRNCTRFSASADAVTKKWGMLRALSPRRRAMTRRMLLSGTGSDSRLPSVSTGGTKCSSRTTEAATAGPGRAIGRVRPGRCRRSGPPRGRLPGPGQHARRRAEEGPRRLHCRRAGRRRAGPDRRHRRRSPSRPAVARCPRLPDHQGDLAPAAGDLRQSRVTPTPTNSNESTIMSSRSLTRFRTVAPAGRIRSNVIVVSRV